MKKITFLLFTTFFSCLSIAQVEGFEGTFPPANWAVFDNGVSAATNVNWTTNSNAYQGLLAAYMNRPGNIGQNNVSEDYLATQLVTVPNNGQLRFYARTFTAGNSGTTVYQVKVAPGTAPINQTTPLAYSTLLAEYNEDQLTLAPDGITQNTFDTYTEKIINFPNTMWGTQVYIAFVLKYTQPGTTLNGDRWLLDNVEVREQCLVPTGLAATPLATTASLAWTGLGASFEIENIQGTGAPTGVATHTSATNSLTISGLNPVTQYCYYVRAVCAPSNNSPWAGPFCYTTSSLPPVCGGNFTDPGGPTGNYGNNLNVTTTICPDNATDLVTVTFTSFATEACCDDLTVYAGVGTGGPVLGTFAGNAIPPEITSTAPGQCLTFVFSSDGSVAAAGWIANVTCAPAPSCPKPTSLVASVVTSTNATLAWTNNSTATTFHVLVLPCGSPAPTAGSTGWVSTTNNPYTFTTLNPDTCYTFYVRGECSSTDLSLWSTGLNATTQPIPPSCGGVFTDSGGANGNYQDNENITTTICPSVAGDQVTVDFLSFETVNQADFLYVYNGNSSAGTLLGTYTGNTLPPSITSSDPSGCLTFVFTSTPQVNLPGWVANVICAPPPTCPRPTNLVTSAVTSTNATLAWTVNSTATTFHVLALPCGSPAPTATTTGWVSTTNNPYTFTSLNPDTCYTFYVRDECSSTDLSLWSTGVNATTQSIPPACGGTFTDPGGASANYGNNANVTTTICADNATNLVTISFLSFATENGFDRLRVYDGPDATAPLIGNFTGNALPPDVSSSVPGGCLTFVFTSDGSVIAAGWVANVICAPAPTCPRPTNLVVSAVTSTNATLAWTVNSTATTFHVLALPCGSPAPTDTTTGWVSTTNNPYTFTTLNPETCYTFYVRDECSSTDLSLWSIGVNATTQPTPPACGGTFTDPGGASANYSNSANVTTTICAPSSTDIVSVSFISFATENNFDRLQVYDGPDATAPLIGNFTGNALPPDVSTSTPGGCLTFVFTSDGSVTAAGWVASIFCGPAPTCSEPTNLTATVLSSSSVTLAWNQPVNPDSTTATTWEVIVQPAGAGAPTATSTGTIVTTNPYTVTGLTPGTNYEFWVRAVCSSTDSSTWAGPRPFVTPVNCGDSQPFCGDTGLTYTNVTGAPSYGAIGCLFTTPNPNWYFMNVNQDGNLTFQISQTSTATGNGIDVDFICWGPFNTSDFSQICGQLYDYPDGNTSFPTNVVACSYSAAPIENFTIPNAVTGQYYVVLITNFSNQAGTVNFVQTNNGQTGAGGTNCDLVCSVELGNNVTLCNQTTYTITSTNENADSYTWYMNNVLMPGEIASSLVVTQSGTYKCVIMCGLNTAEDTVEITFNTLVAPTFNLPSNICKDYTAPVLPTSSTNTTPITGTWSPSIIDTSVVGMTTYTFTPSVGQCASITTVDITIDTPSIVPTFNSIANICKDLSAPSLPTSSTNATPISGLWSPATIDTSVVGTFTYTFTPNSAQCASVTTLDVTIDAPSIVPTFNSISNICKDLPAPSLPASSTNTTAITGTWSPATIDTSVVGTFTYTFTPDAGQCAVPTTIDVTIDAPSIVPTFNPIANICKDLPAPSLPTSSTNATAITGTWSPATIDTTVVGTFTYTFTPDAAQCAVSTTLNVTIDAPSIVPTFNPIANVCKNGTAPVLPSSSTNTTSITGTWSPATINTSVAGTVTYTFTPNAAQCAVSTTLNVTIDEPTVPTFTQLGPYCQGSNLTQPLLPTSSSNGVQGTWSPSSINNLNAGTFTYTFTPNAGLCATTTTMNIVIHPTPNVVAIADVDACDSYVLPSLTVGNYYASPNGLNPITNLTLTTTQTVYVYAQSGTVPNCSDEESFVVTITRSPLFEIEGECVGPLFTLSIINETNITSNADYQWYNGTTPLGIDETQVITTPGNYSCEISVPNGSGDCSTTRFYQAINTLCIIPKGISPNGDGKNDFFDLRGYDVTQLNIYNRFGTVVYSRKSYGNEWNGQSNSGNELPDGTYFYVIERNNAESKTGWVYINRNAN